MATDDRDQFASNSADEAPRANQAPQIIIQQQASMFGRFGKFLLLALVLAVMTIFGLVGAYNSYFNPTTGPQEKFHSLTPEATNKIAIIAVSGPILESDGFVKQQIDRVKEDENVVAVVLRISSPGGTVTASDFLYHHLRQLSNERELPIVVSMGSVCASGGYYVAMAVGDQEDSIYAEPTTWTGSIGVIIPHYNLSGLLNRFDIKEDSISSGPFKQMGSPTHPMSDEERELLQALVDESFGDFKTIVQSGRPKFQENPADLDAVSTGQIFTAKQGLERGLIDKIGFIEAAIERAAELAGYDTDELRCVKFEKPPAPLEALLGGRAGSNDFFSRDLATWLQLTAPRAYYLYTYLPPLLTNSRP